jgi:hypothetical protein
LFFEACANQSCFHLNGFDCRLIVDSTIGCPMDIFTSGKTGTIFVGAPAEIKKHARADAEVEKLYTPH